CAEAPRRRSPGWCTASRAPARAGSAPSIGRSRLPSFDSCLGLLDKLEFLDLARGGGRQLRRLGEQHVLGHLETGQVLPANLDDPFRTELSARLADDPHTPGLAPPVVGHADRVGLADTRQPREQVLDLLGHHQLATALVELLAAAGEL